MSGGFFDYNCFKISQFADELEHEIDTNDDTSLDEFGGTIGNGYSEVTLNQLKEAHEIIELAGKLAREVEWLYSGDHGEESFRRVAKTKMGNLKLMKTMNLDD